MKKTGKGDFLATFLQYKKMLFEKTGGGGGGCFLAYSFNFVIQNKYVQSKWGSAF